MAPPPFEYDRLTDNLLAGRNPLTAADVRILKSEGVTHILDLREPKEWLPPWLGLEALEALKPAGIERVHLPLIDMGAPTPEQLDRACALLREWTSVSEAEVYVHCRAGKERTAAVLVAFVACERGIGYAAALRRLRRKRPIFAPMPHQAKAVQQWTCETNTTGADTI